MALIRNSSLDQLKRVRKQVKAAGGDIADKVTSGSKRKENTLPNSNWMDCPMDRSVDTMNQQIKLETEHMITKFDKFNRLMEDASVCLGADEEKSPQEIMRDMKNIRNMKMEQNPTKERNILTAGKPIEFGDVKGYINRVEGNKVFIETLDGTEVKEYNIKDVFKKVKSEKK